MDSSSPARLYCTLIGAVLVLVGILGFFYEASFATGDEIRSDDALGLLAINGWHNFIHIAIGLVLLAAAGSAARTAALAVGLLYLVLAIWGFIESDNVILGLVPINDEDNVLHLILGLLGLGAGAATANTNVPPASSGSPSGAAGSGACRPGHRRLGQVLGPQVADQLLGAVAQAIGLAAASHTDDHERAGGGAARGDRGYGPDPVAGVAERLQLALGEILGPARELGRGLLGDPGEGRLHPARKVLGRLDRAQGVRQQRLEPQILRLFRHRFIPPPTLHPRSLPRSPAPAA